MGERTANVPVWMEAPCYTAVVNIDYVIIRFGNKSHDEWQSVGMSSQWLTLHKTEVGRDVFGFA